MPGAWSGTEFDFLVSLSKSRLSICICSSEDMSQTTLAIRLPDDLANRLDALARRTGHSKAFFAAEAITLHLEEIEDAYTALERLENPGRRYSLDEAKEELGLDD